MNFLLKGACFQTNLRRLLTRLSTICEIRSLSTSRWFAELERSRQNKVSPVWINPGPGIAPHIPQQAVFLGVNFSTVSSVGAYSHIEQSC